MLRRAYDTLQIFKQIATDEGSNRRYRYIYSFKIFSGSSRAEVVVRRKGVGTGTSPYVLLKPRINYFLFLAARPRRIFDVEIAQATTDTPGVTTSRNETFPVTRYAWLRKKSRENYTTRVFHHSHRIAWIYAAQESFTFFISRIANVKMNLYFRSYFLRRKLFSQSSYN